MSNPEEIYPENGNNDEEGAPAWVVTFGDLMSLLLCFFVLLLSFSEMDRAKYKQVAGSLEKAFGVQRKIKSMETPKGIKMIAKDFDQKVVPDKKRDEFVVTQKDQEVGEELKKEIKTRFKEFQDLIDIDMGEEGVTIRLMGESTFDSGRAYIKKQMIPLLFKIGSLLKKAKSGIIISGHTDNVPLKSGRYKSNLRLSIARSASVAEFLIDRIAIDPSRISTMGFGKYRPIETNDTIEGRRKNRRVEIVLTDIKSLL